jgi:hypothetical protein
MLQTLACRIEDALIEHDLRHLTREEHRQQLERAMGDITASAAAILDFVTPGEIRE